MTLTNTFQPNESFFFLFSFFIFVLIFIGHYHIYVIYICGKKNLSFDQLYEKHAIGSKKRSHLGDWLISNLFLLPNKREQLTCWA